MTKGGLRRRTSLERDYIERTSGTVGVKAIHFKNIKIFLKKLWLYIQPNTLKKKLEVKKKNNVLI